MNNEVASQLKALVEQHGITLCNDPKRCRALLMDSCGNYRKEIHVLISALENGIPGELLSSQNIPFKILRNRLVKKLTDEFALAEQGAGWSIDTWAFALEIQNKMPDIAGELIDKGDLLRDQGKHEEALKFYEKALEIDPRDVYVWNLKGICLGEIGKYDDAMHCYEKALSFDPQYVHAWNNNGWALNQLGRYEEALQCFNKAIEIKPQDAFDWREKGWALDKLGRYEEALRCLDKALGIDPQDAIAWREKGWALGKLGRYEEALPCLDKALGIDPQDAFDWSEKGWALTQLNRFEEALQFFDKALQIDPQYPNAIYNKRYVIAKLAQH